MEEAKTWLITGCSTGLGRNMAKVLLEKGDNVAVTARKAVAVERGAFRTDFSGRSLTQSGSRNDDYEETAGKRRIGADKTDGTQHGDPYRGAQKIVEIVEGGEYEGNVIMVVLKVIKK